MRYALLGPLEVWSDGHPVPVRSPTLRTVLALLILHRNQPVPVERLVDALWERPPGNARKVLQNHLLRLRRVLPGDQPVTTVAGGYQLAAHPDDVDLARFGTLEERAGRAYAAGDPAAAADHLRRALALWRGDPLVDVPSPVLHERYAATLKERRLTASERWVELELRLGRHREVLGELRHLVDDHPLREGLRGHLMLALHRSGRRAEALEVYRETRQLLVDELGVEPHADLQRLHARILDADPALDTAPARDATALAGGGRPTPAQLPRDTYGFTGREAELRELFSLPPEGDAVPVVTIDGGGGVGKSALAVHFAHRCAARFPDGQLFLDLRAFAPSQPPMTEADALGHLLRSLGVEPHQVPEEVPEQAALYRSALAGRRVLIVLDNASSSEQVRTLLPSSAGSLVVVTSRNRLSGLIARDGAHRVALGVLAHRDAVALLARVAGADRVTADPAVADELARLCGHLPLALRIAGERLATGRYAGPAALVAELAGSPDRLDVFTTEEEGTAVRSVFSWSYRALPAPAARTFRLLGLHTGPDLGAAAAAALCGTDTREVRRLLEELVAAHLVEPAGVDRYRLHDLVRAYAAERAEADEPAGERAAAVHRLLSWYLSNAVAADRVLALQPHGQPLGGVDATVRPLSYEDQRQAARWCEAEAGNLVAACYQAEAAGHLEIAWRLPAALWSWFHLRHDVRTWWATHQLALAAARRLGNEYGVATILNRLGMARQDQGRWADAEGLHVAALARYTAIGDRIGQGHARAALAIALIHQEKLDEALVCLDTVRTDVAVTGDRWCAAVALTATGLARSLRGEPVAARTAFAEALVMRRETADRWGEAVTRTMLAGANLALGEVTAARDDARRALSLYAEVGNRHGAAQALQVLGETDLRLGDADTAQESWQRAASIFEELSDPQAEQLRSRLAAIGA